MHDAKEKLGRYAKLMKEAAAAKRSGTVPKCRLCRFYRPDFRYRRCLCSVCPYGRSGEEVFRKKPLRKGKKR